MPASSCVGFETFPHDRDVLVKGEIESVSRPCSKRPGLAIWLALGMAGTQPITSVAGSLEANRALIKTDAAFTADKFILDQAAIMVELYYRMDEDEALFFDPLEPQVVFGKTSLRNLDEDQASDSLNLALKAMRNHVHMVIAAGAEAWRAVPEIQSWEIPEDWDAEEVLASADRMAYRRGMRRTFRRSLENSFAFAPQLDSVLKAHGLPTRLKYLPHVESRFQSDAQSPAGAVGLWQLMKSFAGPDLVIDNRMDQRLDPKASTIAAARFLKRCQRDLGSWPLALMAYNNGLGKIQNAIDATGSDEPVDIIRNFSEARFGSVSRNYYAMFLAASSLAMQAEKLYPGLRKHAPAPYRTLTLNHAWTPRQLRLLSGYSLAVIRACNPELLTIVFNRNLPVPAGFALKLPPGKPSRQDLEFADIRTGKREVQEGSAPFTLKGFPIPKFAEKLVGRLREVIFRNTDTSVGNELAYLNSQGVLSARCLAQAQQDQILIEPHPVVHAALIAQGG